MISLDDIRPVRFVPLILTLLFLCFGVAGCRVTVLSPSSDDTARDRNAVLEEENQALTAQLTKIESLKRAAKMQRDRRGVLRKMENAQENTESPAAKKRNTKGSASSTTVNNNS